MYVVHAVHTMHQERFKHLKKENKEKKKRKENERETRTWLDIHTSTSNNPHDHIILTFPVSFFGFVFSLSSFILGFFFFLDLGFEG